MFLTLAEVFIRHVGSEYLAKLMRWTGCMISDVLWVNLRPTFQLIAVDLSVRSTTTLKTQGVFGGKLKTSDSISSV